MLNSLNVGYFTLQRKTGVRKQLFIYVRSLNRLIVQSTYVFHVIVLTARITV